MIWENWIKLFFSILMDKNPLQPLLKTKDVFLFFSFVEFFLNSYSKIIPFLGFVCEDSFTLTIWDFTDSFDLIFSVFFLFDQLYFFDHTQNTTQYSFSFLFFFFNFFSCIYTIVFNIIIHKSSSYAQGMENILYSLFPLSLGIWNQKTFTCIQAPIFTVAHPLKILSLVIVNYNGSFFFCREFGYETSDVEYLPVAADACRFITNKSNFFIKRNSIPSLQVDD